MAGVVDIDAHIGVPRLQGLQIELENAALSEYPNAVPPLRYTGDAPIDGATGISSEAMLNALASDGENIDMD